ncbi:MAG: helix-turn-helix transcriptional regulator [Chloroflexi bacterium]|nr:helix-turn-helix transcriptional regulator [Chloroflexota bacterium]
MALLLMEEAAHLTETRGLSRSQLASIMGVSRAHVSKLFNAPPNLTLLSIARLGIALGVRPYVCLDSLQMIPQFNASSAQEPTEESQLHAELLGSAADRRPWLSAHDSATSPNVDSAA